MRKLNSRGAALANIMLISAFVMVLASTIISIAMSNYRMKLININSKNNFYSCEALLDELRVGFRNDMTKYGQNTTSDYATFSAMFDYYKAKADGTSNDIVISGNNGTGRYYDMATVVANIKNIEGVSVSEWVPTDPGKDYKNSYKTEVDKDGRKIYVTVETQITPATKEYNLILDNTSITFKNITVTYEQNGYINSITSDIKLWFDGEIEQDNDPILDYSVVAKDSMSLVTDDHLNIIFKGSMFVAQKKDVEDATLYARNSISQWSKDPGSFALMIHVPYANRKYEVVRVEGNKIIIDGNIVMGPDAILDLRKCKKVYLNGSIYYPEVVSKSNESIHKQYPAMGKILVAPETEIFFSEKVQHSMGIYVCNTDAYIGNPNNLAECSISNLSVINDENLSPLSLNSGNSKLHHISSTNSVFENVYDLYFPEHKVIKASGQDNCHEGKTKTYYYDIGRSANPNLFSEKSDGGDSSYKISIGPLTTVNSSSAIATLVVNNDNSKDVMLQQTIHNMSIFSAHSFNLQQKEILIENPQEGKYSYDDFMKCKIRVATAKGYDNDKLTGTSHNMSDVYIPFSEMFGDIVNSATDSGDNTNNEDKDLVKHTNLAISYQNWQRN